MPSIVNQNNLKYFQSQLLKFETSGGGKSEMQYATCSIGFFYHLRLQNFCFEIINDGKILELLMKSMAYEISKMRAGILCTTNDEKFQVEWILIEFLYAVCTAHQLLHGQYCQMNELLKRFVCKMVDECAEHCEHSY